MKPDSRRVKVAVGALALVALLTLAPLIVIKARESIADQKQRSFVYGLQAQAKSRIRQGTSPEDAVSSAIQDAPSWEEGGHDPNELKDWGFTWSISSSGDRGYLEVRFLRPKPKSGSLTIWP